MLCSDGITLVKVQSSIILGWYMVPRQQDFEKFKTMDYRSNEIDNGNGYNVA